MMKISTASLVLFLSASCNGLAPDIPPRGDKNIPDPELPHGDESNIHPLGHTPQPGAFKAGIPFLHGMEPPSANDPLIPREQREGMPGPWGPPPPGGPWPPAPGMMPPPPGLIGPPIMGPLYNGPMSQFGGPNSPMSQFGSGPMEPPPFPRPPGMMDFSQTQGEMMRPHPGMGDGSDDYHHPMQGPGDGFWQNKFQSMGGQQDYRNSFGMDSVIDPDQGYHEEGEYKPLQPPTGNEQHPMQGGDSMWQNKMNKGQAPNKPPGMVDFSSTQEEMMRPHPGFDNASKDNNSNNNKAPTPSPTNNLDANGRPKPQGMVDFSKTQAEMMRPHPGGGDGSADVIHPVQGAGDGYWQNKFKKSDVRHQTPEDQFQVPKEFKDWVEDPNDPTNNVIHNKDKNFRIGKEEKFQRPPRMDGPGSEFFEPRQQKQQDIPSSGDMPSRIEENPPVMGNMPNSPPSPPNMLRPRPPGYEQDGGDVVHPIQGAGDGYWQKKFANRDARFQAPRGFVDPNRHVVDMDRGFRDEGERYEPMYPEGPFRGDDRYEPMFPEGRPMRMDMDMEDFGGPPPPPGYPFDQPPEPMRAPRPRNSRNMWPYNMNPPGPQHFASELNSHRPMEDPNMQHPPPGDFDYFEYYEGPPPPGLSRSQYEWYNSGQNDHTRRQDDIDGLLYY